MSHEYPEYMLEQFPFSFYCSRCNHLINIQYKDAGEIIECPNCKKTFIKYKSDFVETLDAYRKALRD